MNAGIDYGMGRVNISDDGIRYGVIPHRAVGMVWYEESELYYGEPCCPECGDDDVTEIDDYCYKCNYCNIEFDNENAYSEEPLSVYYTKDGYEAECNDEVDIFITKSPYYTYAQFCSPCAPGACYLLNPLNEKIENNKCFCFGHDWFENEKAPYPVYSVETGKEI